MESEIRIKEILKIIWTLTKKIDFYETLNNFCLFYWTWNFNTVYYLKLFFIVFYR